ncbi:MAG: FAD-dependent oxidoreductase, partial [Planctomycetota bacterium]
VIAATGPFQRPVIPPVVPEHAPIFQLHSKSYRNPEQLPPGGVLVVGSSSSGAQIAEELLRAGRDVYLSIGPHDRPPRRYRGQDYCHWLGVLGKWSAVAPAAGREHVTIAVAGAHGGYTVDFRALAEQGVTLLGQTEGYQTGVLSFRADLAQNLEKGDANYLGLLDEVDAYIAREGLDLPLETDARTVLPEPDCVANPVLRLDVEEVGLGTILWATGYAQDFGWLRVDAFTDTGAPDHVQGVGRQSGIYFLGLPWLSMRGSSFIWGVYKDAERLAHHIAAREG